MKTPVLWPAAVVVLFAQSSRADFAPPPDGRCRAGNCSYSEEEPFEPSARPRPSEAGLGVRLSVGPATLLAPVSPGLMGGLDLGRGAVGARLSAAFLGAESARGIVAYGGELWIDFRPRASLHPVLGAGASYLHGRGLGASGGVGAGLLRGALEYELPLDEADARIGLNLLSWVPAIGTERTRPWTAGALHVAIGF